MSGSVHHLTALDATLSERLFAAADIDCRPDWDDVQTRAEPLGLPHRRTRRRSYVAAIAAVLAASIVAPAVGLPGAVVDFFRAEPAAETVVLDFVGMNQRGPQDPSLPDQARHVRTFELPSGAYTLSIAPTAGGGYCWAISGFSNGCQTIRSTDSTGRGPVIGVTYTEIPTGSVRQEPVIIAGNIASTASGTLSLTFEDGSSQAVPLVWVSEPIAAAFFVYELPRERWSAGSRPIGLELRDTGGIVAHTKISVAPQP